MLVGLLVEVSEAGTFLGVISAVLAAVRWTVRTAPVAVMVVLLVAPLVVVIAAWREGRRRGALPRWLATAAEAEADLSIDETTIAQALGALRIPQITEHLKRGVPLQYLTTARRDGRGTHAVIRLPAGVTAEKIARRRADLATGLHRLAKEVWPTTGSEAGILDLWIADKGALAEGAGPYPLLTDGAVDVFRGVPFGKTLRGEPLTAPVMERNTLTGGMPGQGKSSAARVLMCGAALDVTRRRAGRARLHLLAAGARRALPLRPAPPLPGDRAAPQRQALAALPWLQGHRAAAASGSPCVELDPRAGRGDPKAATMTRFTELVPRAAAGLVPRRSRVARTATPVPRHRPARRGRWRLLTPAPALTYLAAGERCLGETRRHWVVPLRAVAGASVMMSAAVPLAAVLAFLAPGVLLFHAVLWPAVLWPAVLAHSGYLFWCVLKWRIEQIVVTDQRIVRVSGVLTLTADSVQLSQVTDTTLRCTLAGRVLGYGTVRVESAGQRQDLETLDYVPDAPAVYRVVIGALSTP